MICHLPAFSAIVLPCSKYPITLSDDCLTDLAAQWQLADPTHPRDLVTLFPTPTGNDTFFVIASVTRCFCTAKAVLTVLEMIRGDSMLRQFVTSS
ncbi:unnamed protein product [Protopolystoma xenopodis]|uniref:Uncharacterized protein n=1 Tax=Protopolystoma xenopodis TaxID=117903 RepID=A0A3S5CGJ3_9PLAT|nr:unnamed protein product [Protopolystoma xenopodis]